MEVGYADLVAADRADVLKHFGLQDAPVLEVQGGWQERIAGWLSDPVVKSALVGNYISGRDDGSENGRNRSRRFEIGLVATAMFFGSQWVTGVATWV